jgi:predicted SAM-dependent methyltransferase
VKLHIGSKVRTEGWKTLDIAAGPDVDYVGDCKSLPQFSDESIETLYASHVLEHVPYWQTVLVLKEWLRVLIPGGMAMIAVPDLETLCRLYLHPESSPLDRVNLMRMMFGGQIDEHDFHFIGFNGELLRARLREAGFAEVKRVADFGLFKDTSLLQYRGVPISLNVTARKPVAGR